VTARPTHYEGPCPGAFTFVGSITVSRGGTVTYRWSGGDGGSTGEKKASRDGAGVIEVRSTWTVGGPNQTRFEGTQELHVLSPESASGGARFTMVCAPQTRKPD
jgi:hypothetical protein